MQAIDKKKEVNESFRDRIATVDAKGKRNWVYAQKPKGRLYNARTIVSLFFFGIFMALPFIYVNGRPLFLFNIPKAKFIILGKVFWPQDFFIFGITMVAFVVFIVLFTAAFGRLFCGWVCPQTNFMEMLFRRIEYAIEGDAPQQKALAKSEWNSTKIVKKALKHFVFYLISFVIANYFLAYIIGVEELWAMMKSPFTNLGTLAGLIVFTYVFYAVYAFFREQACTVVCPYGRLQGVLLDKNSVVVAYDYKRGETRAKFKKNEERAAGDCIDCHQCVKVCPTGIDIRNGTQLECINCTACIDACDHMMESVGFKKGLIRFASENNIASGEKQHYTTRMKLYTVLLIGLLGLLGVMIFSLKDVKATVIRTPGMLFQEVGKDSISNLYNIKVVNKTMKPIPLTVKLESGNGTVKMVGDFIHVQKEGQGAGAFFVILNNQSIKERKTEIKLGLYEGNRKISDVTTNFLGPIYSGE
ncbi:cytochrome c oxidase accessory protein CcoG [Lacibacter sp. MH-610]|uniref:cytochrome c oxidase accessory protein CcoG n=1 Tax=Lacibacter sp. MH-610 TaxID=3020883 RepID=UPI0038913B54